VRGGAVGGPYQPTGRGDSPSRARIFVCRPAPGRSEQSCARTILRTLARRAYRRPVTASDIDPLMAFYERGRRDADFDAGIEAALQALLVTPDFLFRVERDPHASPASRDRSQPVAARLHRVSDLELASRLSFFLWSSIPDDPLLDLAERGRLRDRAVLQQQVHRMLADARSSALVENFAGQWLYLRNIAVVRPDQRTFAFDPDLRASMAQETTLFVDSILREDRSALDFLAADYTFVNERLARHYGIPGIHGPQLRRISVDDPNRRGLLGQGTILTVTS